MRLGPLESLSPQCATRGGRYLLGDFRPFFAFVPQMGDRTPSEGLGWILTHPPVVFGPHRSPRGEGHTISRPDAAGDRHAVVTARGRSCNIWVTG